MTSEVGHRSLDPKPPETTAQPPAKSPESAVPPVELTPYGSSDDELNLLLGGSPAELKPDPFLVPGSSSNPDAVPVAATEGPPPSESFEAVAPVDHPAAKERSSVPAAVSQDSFDPMAPLSSDEHTIPRLAASTSVAASSGDFPAIDLSAPPSSSRVALPTDDDEVADNDEGLPNRTRSWLTLLLFSYASAVTLGLLWILWSGRKLREAESPEPAPVVDSRPDPGVRADRSRKIEPLTPLAADHLTTLGKPLRAGSLEISPLRVNSSAVALRRAVGEHERRDGGAGALALVLMLKNLSSDTIFAPLDEAYIREREPGAPDSLIETGKGGEIGMYPLAVASEWSIVGQEFRELRPGQSFETVVVSASDATHKLTPDMTWRIRLRTGINQTETIGVQFHKDDVKPAD